MPDHGKRALVTLVQNVKWDGGFWPEDETRLLQGDAVREALKNPELALRSYSPFFERIDIGLNDSHPHRHPLGVIGTVEDEEAVHLRKHISRDGQPEKHERSWPEGLPPRGTERPDEEVDEDIQPEKPERNPVDPRHRRQLDRRKIIGLGVAEGEPGKGGLGEGMKVFKCHPDEGEKTDRISGAEPLPDRDPGGDREKEKQGMGEDQGGSRRHEIGVFPMSESSRPVQGDQIEHKEGGVGKAEGSCIPRLLLAEEEERDEGRCGWYSCRDGRKG